MMKPRVSVVMPAYQAARTLANAVNSIVNQTYQDWELIVVNDGSDDLETLMMESIVKKFDDKRIRMITKPHSGLVAARNVGNELAEGEIIVVQDADDLSLPDRIEKCLKVIDKGAEVVYHGIYINMWDAGHNCIGRKYVPAEIFDMKRIKKEQYIPGPCVLRKEVWQKWPYRMETQYAFDWAQYLDWGFNWVDIVPLDVGLYEYVRHENSASITFERDGRRAQSFDKIKEIIKEYESKM